MSGMILVNPIDTLKSRFKLRQTYIRRTFALPHESPIRVFLRKSKTAWDLLKNKKGWVCDPELYKATTEQLVQKEYSNTSPRYYTRLDDYILLIPTPVGNLVFTIEMFDPKKVYTDREHNVAVAAPEVLLPYIGHEFEDIDEVLGMIHYRTDVDEDDGLLYRQVEEIIYREAANKVCWVIAAVILILAVSTIGS